MATNAITGRCPLYVPCHIFETLGDIDTDPGVLVLQREIAQVKTETVDTIVAFDAQGPNIDTLR